MDDHPHEGDVEEHERPRDPILDQAIGRVLELFDAEPNRLFHSTQIETVLEREFFHWITGRALLEIAQSGAVRKRTTMIAGKPVNFYASKKYRYWEREHRRKVALLQRIFDPDSSQAIGRHGELMFDAALGRAGFRADARNAKTWQGRSWGLTNHNLDRIYTAGGFALLFEDQMYPWGHSDLLREVRNSLGLKVAAPSDVRDGDIQRLEKWHARRLARG